MTLNTRQRYALRARATSAPHPKTLAALQSGLIAAQDAAQGDIVGVSVPYWASDKVARQSAGGSFWQLDRGSINCCSAINLPPAQAAGAALAFACVLEDLVLRTIGLYLHEILPPEDEDQRYHTVDIVALKHGLALVRRMPDIADIHDSCRATFQALLPHRVQVFVQRGLSQHDLLTQISCLSAFLTGVMNCPKPFHHIKPDEPPRIPLQIDILPPIDLWTPS